MKTIKQVIVPVKDIDAAIDFYALHLGFALKFKDGQRYAALDGGSVTLALVSREENVTNGVAAFAVGVEDAESFVRDAAKGGVTVLQDVSQGPHESRAVIADLDGHPIVVSSRN